MSNSKACTYWDICVWYSLTLVPSVSPLHILPLLVEEHVFLMRKSCSPCSSDRMGSSSHEIIIYSWCSLHGKVLCKVKARSCLKSSLVVYSSCSLHGKVFQCVILTSHTWITLHVA